MPSNVHVLVVRRDGTLEAVYHDDIAASLATISGGLSPEIKRASHVEPNEAGEWVADLSPVGGPQLGPFKSRSQALSKEVAWLHEFYLGRNPQGEII